MKKLGQLGLVLAGYVLAFLVASVVVSIHMRQTQGHDAQAAAGMYAGGDTFLFGAVFGFVALFPTGLALYYLRSFPESWAKLATAACALAATGPIAVGFAVWASSHVLENTIMAVPETLAIVRLYASPLVAVLFLLSGILAPAGRARRLLIGATLVEFLVAAYVFLHLSSVLFLH